METTYSFGPQTFVGASADSDWNAHLDKFVKLTSSGQVTLCTAITDIAIGTVQAAEGLVGGTWNVTVASLTRNGSIRAIQAAAITPGVRVCLDATTFTSVRTQPATTGTYRCVGVKLGTAAGAGGDIIEIMPYTETTAVA